MNYSDTFRELIEIGFIVVPASCQCGGWYAWINPDHRMVGCICHNQPSRILEEWRGQHGDRVIGIFSKDPDLGRKFQMSLVSIQDVDTRYASFPEIHLNDGKKYYLYSYPFEPHCGVRHNKIYISTSLMASDMVNTIIRPFLCYPFDDKPEVWYDEVTGTILEDE